MQRMWEPTPYAILEKVASKLKGVFLRRSVSGNDMVLVAPYLYPYSLVSLIDPDPFVDRYGETFAITISKP